MKNLSLTLLAWLLCFAAFAQTPTPIAGRTSMCGSDTIMLSDAVSGGMWSSSNPAIAFVGSVSGLVTSVSAGSVTITYATTGGFATSIITIYPLPTSFSITGGGAFCAGGTGVAIGINGSQVGVSYGLNVSGVSTGIILAGTGLPLSFGVFTTAGTYTVNGDDAVTTCVNNMTGAAAISVGALPNAYNVSGGGGICSGGSGVHVTLSGSSPGVNYQLFNGTTAVGIAIAGTGGLLDFGTFTAPGTYTAVGSNATTGCSNNMTGSATITVGALPTAFLVMGGGAYCVGGAGVHVGLNYSVTGVNYQLFIAGVPVGSPIPGSSAALDFGLQTTAGTYTAMATNVSTGCANTMTGSAVVSISPLPTSTYSVTGGGSFCAGAAGLHVGLSGSDTGTSYVLYGGTGAIGTMTGTGAPLDFGLETGASVYSIGATTGSACTASMTGTVSITVDPTPSLETVTGGGNYCAGGTGLAVDLAGSVIGINYQLYNGASAVGSPVPGTGSTISFGIMTAAGSYTVGASDAVTGCADTMAGTATITVNTLPTVTASATSACGGIYTLTAGGALSYSWAPATGLSCATCASATSTPTVSATYTVTGTDAAGCVNTATASVDGNRISGVIAIAGSSPSLKVWLIQFNPSDSSITSLDSTMACTSGSSSYYEFMDKTPGNYMVKAQLTTSVPGTSDYIPTYGTSTPNWYTAATVAHTTATDNLDINMIYGTVPSGPGFISGYVYAGAGRGTTGDAPVEGMLVYLKDPVTGLIMTYSYTDATGAYSFSGLAFGNYTIYPENFNSNTIPSSVIVLSTDAPVATGLNFRQYTDSKIIKPITASSVSLISASNGISMFPNPATGKLNVSWNNPATGQAKMTITDVAGRVVYSRSLDLGSVSGIAAVDISSLNNGVYMVHITGAEINYNSKLVIE